MDPTDWALAILMVVSGHGIAESANPPGSWSGLLELWSRGLAQTLDDRQLLALFEDDLSARVEDAWGEPHDLEELQRQLTRTDVQQALIRIARADLMVARADASRSA